MKQRHQTAIALVGLVLLSLSASASARADEPSAADRQTARTLLLEGRKAFDAKDFNAALKSFKAAHALMGVPTTGLALARSQEALGQLVEARVTAFEASLFPVKPREPAAFTEARKAAAELAARLDARVPSIELHIAGPSIEAVEVSIDGEPIPTDAIAAPRKLNPGEHEVVASAAGHTTERRTVTLKDGEAKPVEVHIKLAPIALPKPKVEPPKPPPPKVEVERPVPVWAWVAGGAGVAALGVSVGFAINHAGARSAVASECPGNVCDPKTHDAESMQALRARWDRSLGLCLGLGALGLAGVGTSIAGFVLRPGKGPVSAFAPVIQPGFQGFVGTGAF